jgi:predicted ATP-dependent protease
VLIPASNVQNLMLRPDVVAAVREGQFRVWAVETVDEAIALLTGVVAGERQADGRFPPGTLHNLVDRRLSQLAKRLGAQARGTEARSESAANSPSTESEARS